MNIKKNISKKQLREFGFLLGLIFPIFIGFLIPLISGHSLRIWTLWIGLPLIIFALIKPSFLRYPYKFWMSLGNILGYINSRLILGIVFFFILQPIALFMRIIGYDPLRKKRGLKKSYRENKKGHTINLTRIF